MNPGPYTYWWKDLADQEISYYLWQFCGEASNRNSFSVSTYPGLKERLISVATESYKHTPQIEVQQRGTKDE